MARPGGRWATIAAMTSASDWHWHARAWMARRRWAATGTAPKAASMAQLAQLGRDVASEIRAGAKGNLPVFGDER